MAALSSAALFFERILRDRVPFLRSLIDSRTQETEGLEFKGGAHLDDAEIKANWSRALCGFANNQGGVLVWGIDARLDVATKVDAANAVSLAPSPESLRTKLTQLHPTATDPPIPGVRMETVFDNGTDGPGFVACFIPESQTKPHRADYLQGKPYVIRVGGSFINPSPSILRNLFYPRSSARLWVEVQPKWQTQGDSAPAAITVDYRVTLHNGGLVSARDIFVVVHIEPSPMEFHLPYGVVKQDTHRDGTGLEFPRTIHPSSAQHLCLIRQQAQAASQFNQSETKYVPGVELAKFSFRIFATDTSPTHLEVVLTDWDIQTQTAKVGRPAPAVSGDE